MNPPLTSLSLLTLALVLGACAGPAQVASSTAASEALACTLPTNCVSSMGSSGLPPLAYTGTPAQAMAQLKATLAAFPEATVQHSSALSLQAVFTTPVGFKDEVAFRIDENRQRIDFRSRSGLGLYDFGKNRSRMQAVSARFLAGAGR